MHTQVSQSDTSSAPHKRSNTLDSLVSVTIEHRSVYLALECQSLHLSVYLDTSIMSVCVRKDLYEC